MYVKSIRKQLETLEMSLRSIIQVGYGYQNETKATITELQVRRPW